MKIIAFFTHLHYLHFLMRNLKFYKIWLNYQLFGLSFANLFIFFNLRNFINYLKMSTPIIFWNIGFMFWINNFTFIHIFNIRKRNLLITYKSFLCNSKDRIIFSKFIKIIHEQNCFAKNFNSLEIILTNKLNYVFKI